MIPHHETIQEFHGMFTQNIFENNKLTRQTS